MIRLTALTGEHWFIRGPTAAERRHFLSDTGDNPVYRNDIWVFYSKGEQVKASGISRQGLE